MTVSTTTRKKSYTGNGSTTVFAYDFRIFNDSDLKVYVAGVLKSLSTHYTVSGAGAASGGNVTFTSGNTPASSASVVIIRELPRTQATDYVDNSALSATALEDTADKNLMLIQEIDAKAGDGFRFADTVVDAGTITIDKNAADRGNKVLSFDSNGHLIATQEIGVSRGNWAASTAYAQRDIIKDTNNNNIYLCIVAHTSSGSVPISTNTDAAKWVLLVDAASATTSQTAAASSASSASSSASTATAQAVIATAKAVLTASDATDTAADLVETAADVVLAEAAKVAAEAATGASAFKYTFDNSTTMADPGSAGEIRFNHGTVGSVTALAIRATSADTSNPDISPFIASWDDGTNSAHEGYITIRKSGTPATYAVFSLTGAVVDNTAWLQLPVTHVSSNGSWSNADTMYISFARSGNLGATGPTGSTGSTGSTGPRGSDAGLDMTFESTTTDTDQGVGKVWFNHGTLSSASVLYMDDVDANSANINSLVDSWDDSTTTALRGTIKVTQQASSAVFAIYNVTGAVTSASTYSKVAVTYVTGAGSFSDGDACNVDFSRTGNTGSAGSSTPADNVFRIQDNSDNTKQIAFEASSIGSGTTRTITMPNSDVTLGTPLADTVTGAKIADDAIDSEHYVDGSIDTAHLANDAVTGAKIADDAIDSEHYTDASIDAVHIASNAVTTAKINADAVTGAKIADDAIDSEHYVDGSIDTAHIADDQITLAKMAGGTDGTIISFDASGNPVAIGPGSDGQVLTSTGAGSPPAFETPSGGSWTLINSTVASDDSSITITGLDSTYTTYALVGADLKPATNNSVLYMRVGDSSGVDSGASDYSYYATNVGTGDSGAPHAAGNSNSTSFMKVGHAVGSSAEDATSFMVYLNRGTSYPNIYVTFSNQDNASPGNVTGGYTIGQREAVITLDRVQVLFSSGNIASGRFSVFGIKHT